MTLVQIKILIDLYLDNDQPSIGLALTELRIWLRDRQTNGDIHAFSIRQYSKNMVIDVQLGSAFQTHTLHFNEDDWLKSTGSQAQPKTHTKLVPSRKKIVERKPESPADAYDRAMRGV